MQWNQYYRIDTEWIEDGDFGSHYEFFIVVIATEEKVGSYKDEAYAKKQAKHKYRKLQAKVERILLMPEG